jgi:hypothetical protein
MTSRILDTIKVGSCVTRVHRATMHTHPLNQRRCDALRMDHGCIRRHLERQVALMDSTEGAQIGAKRCAGPLAGVAVHLTWAISLIIPRPLVHAVADRRVVGMAPALALPLIGVEPRAAHRDVLRGQRRAGARLGRLAAPHALLPRLAREQTDERGTLMGVGPVPVPFLGAPPGRSGGVSMGGACFPPRCGTAPRLQRRCPPSWPSVPSHEGGPEYAAVASGAVGVRDPTRGRGGPSTRPSPLHGVTTPRSPGVAAFARRWSPAPGYSRPHRPDRGRLEHALGWARR